jgi:hypothetical protein
MLKRICCLLILSGFLWVSGCASDSRSFKYSTAPPYSQQDWCRMGAVYCGPGP